MIPNKLVIVGPSIVTIAGVPAPPLALPFGFFPISKKRRAGIIFPKEPEYSEFYGFGFRDFGYYIPISDRMDLKLISSIYFKGSWGIKASSNYNKKYKYNGNFEIDFQNLIRERTDTIGKIITRPINILWRHNQGAGAHPYRTLGGSIQIQTNGYNRTVSRNAGDVLNNALRSNFNFGYQFPNSPFSISSGFEHSQNTRYGTVDISFPTLNVNMRQITPFKRKFSSSKELWYEKITVNYNSIFRNTLHTQDSILFTDKVFDQFKYGAQHNTGASASFSIFKYIGLTPSINYKEEWIFKTQSLSFNSKPDIINGIPIYGKIDTSYKKGIFALRTMNASLNANTRLYGLIQKQKGWFRGIRHEISPTVSLNFAPDYHGGLFNYYDSVDTDSRRKYNQKREYFVFADSPFGTSGAGTENFVINGGFNNRVELKYWSKRDSGYKKIALIEGLSFSSSYDVFRDSMRLSNINGSGANRFFKGITTINYSLTLSPYHRNLINGKEQLSKEYAWKATKRLAYLESARVSISSSSSIRQIREFFNKKTRTDQAQNELPEFSNLFNEFVVNHFFSFNHNRLSTGKDSVYLSAHTLSVVGNLNLTPKWRILLGHIGYDFLNKSITYPEFGFERDLHCWTMRFLWRPEFRSYQFFIGVKPGSLEFIRIPSNKFNLGR